MCKKYPCELIVKRNWSVNFFSFFFKFSTSHLWAWQTWHMILTHGTFRRHRQKMRGICNHSALRRTSSRYWAIHTRGTTSTPTTADISHARHAVVICGTMTTIERFQELKSEFLWENINIDIPNCPSHHDITQNIEINLLGWSELKTSVNQYDVE